MVRKLVKKLSFPMIIAICALLGTFLGTSIAYADVDHNLSVGTYTYTSTHDVSLYTGEEYYYQAKQRVTLSSDKSDVTFVTGSFSSPYYSTTYRYGDSNDPDYMCFGPLYIWDEYGYHSIYYLDFIGVLIDGCSCYRSTYWYYGNMNSTNNHVISEQIIWSSEPSADYISSDCNLYITEGE
jgi:hypothetical protein